MLLKSYSLKSNLSKLTSGPYFISSIKILKCFETNSCTSPTIPGKLLFHSHLNYTLKHQKKIRNRLGRDPSVKVEMENDTALQGVFEAAFARARVPGEAPRQLRTGTAAHTQGQYQVFRTFLCELPKLNYLLCTHINISNSFLISN